MFRKSFLIAFFTTIVRYYDYALFGLSAGILSEKFFPKHQNQLLLFYIVYTVSVLARPIGALVLGFISDKYGRTKSIKISIFLGSISTTFIALIPDFDSIGLLATFILTFCRMIFLFSLSGDVDGIKIHVVEKIGIAHKNFINSVIIFCSQIGALLAAYIFYLSNLLLNFSLWRINFVIGGVLGMIIIMMRRSFVESENFLENKRKICLSKINFLDLLFILKKVLPRFLIVIIITGSIGGIYQFLAIFWCVFISKATDIISTHDAQKINIYIILIYAIGSIASGLLADFFNSKKQVYLSLIFSIIITAYFIFNKNIAVHFFSLTLSIIAPFYIAPLQVVLQTMFVISVRARIYTLSHSIGGILISSTTPFFATLVWNYTNSIYFVMCFFLVLLLLLLIIVVLLYNKVQYFKSEYLQF